MKENKTKKSSERMPNIAFKAMSFIFIIRDIFTSPGKKISKFNIAKGDTVVDYGCGPGNYLPFAAELTGPAGTVYALDVHELAIESVNKLIQKKGLTNVKTALVKDYITPLKDDTADIVYALDMFFMVEDPDRFLKEIHRITKKNGRLIIEDGHQPRSRSIEKINHSGQWNIIENRKEWLVCVPN